MTAPWGDARADRFWCRRDASVHLDDDGFLSDPTGRWGSRINPDVEALGGLRDARCLVIIGEPGAGKSDTLREHSPLLQDSTPPPTIPVVTVDLAEYGTEDRLASTLFEHPEVRSWQAGRGELCVVLDSLDECQERVSHIATVLGGELARWPTDRLYLRICCRTGDWPESLQERLEKMFGEVAVFELLPLTRDGAAALCTATDVAAPQFLAAVRNARVGPLAARPLTLDLLLRVYRSAGQFPDDVGALYRDALLLLAEEPEGRRREAQPPGRLSPAERIAVASRLAALSTFGQRAAFWTGRSDQTPDGDLAIRDCAGSTVPAPTGPVAVSEDAVRETLRTGLFSSRGAARIGWAHHTFAEHLAARFLLAQELHQKQVRSLLLAPDGQVYPQLRAVAAWLLALSADGAFDWLVDEDVELLLTAPVKIARATVCERALTRLFQLAATGDYHRRFGHRFDGLAYPGLENAVGRMLREGDEEQRLLALEIAGDCAVPDSRAHLVATVLDVAQDYQVRVGAAHALRTIAQHEPTTELTALAVAPSGEDDQQDELKGCALRLSWPDAMPTSEVFDALTAPRRRNLLGAYAMFVEHAFPDALTPADVEAGMAWLLTLERSGGRHDRFDRLADRVVTLALDAIENPEVADQVAQLALLRAASHQSLFVDNYGRNDTKPELTIDQRHQIIAAAIQRVAPDEVEHLVHYSAGGPGLVTRDDLAWLIDRFDTEDEQRDVVTQLIESIFHPAVAGHSQLVLDLPPDHPLRASLSYWLTPVELDSDQARQAQERQKRFQERVEPTQTPPSNEEVEGKICYFLDQFDQGDPSGFWQACYLVHLPPNATHFRNEPDPDLTAQPRWGVLPEDIRARLVAAARSYLDVAECQPSEWLGTDIYWRPAHAGYRALLLLKRLDPNALASLPADVWREWAPIVLAEHTAHGAGNWDDKMPLVDLAVEHAPDEVFDAAVALIEGESSRGEHIFRDHEIDRIWSPRLTAWLSQALAAGDLKEPTAADATALLARNDADGGRSVLHDLLADGTDAGRRAYVGALLLAHDAKPSWPVLYDVLQHEPEIGMQLVSEHAAGTSYRDSSPAIGDSDLADLYVWLVRHLPPAEDPDIDGVHFVGPREQLARWRDNILQTLENRGTTSAVNAIARIEAALPDQPWLRALRRDAETTLRRTTWQPVAPEALLDLASSAERRLVTTTAELLDVVLEALSKIQTRLTGETPESQLLWDTRSDKPKFEEDISDYLLHRLEDLLVEHRVVVSREVQVRRMGRGIGERTDLRIDAVHVDDGVATPLTVIIEVKGAWNADLTGSLRSQLVDHYMSDVGSKHGVYLVAWPEREKTPAESRKCADLAAEVDALAAVGTFVAVVHLDFARERPAPSV